MVFVSFTETDALVGAKFSDAIAPEDVVIVEAIHLSERKIPDTTHLERGKRDDVRGDTSWLVLSNRTVAYATLKHKTRSSSTKRPG